MKIIGHRNKIEKEGSPYWSHTIVFGLHGAIDTRTGEVYVFLNDQELKPERSLKVRDHSPDGFQWGYRGSGPAQLALAVCLELLGTDDAAMQCYQSFKENVIAKLQSGQPFKIMTQVEFVYPAVDDVALLCGEANVAYISHDQTSSNDSQMDLGFFDDFPLDN